MSSGFNLGSKIEAIDAPALQAPAAPVLKRSAGRLAFNLVEPAVILGDFFVIFIACLIGGIGYQWIELNTIGTAQQFLAEGALLFINVTALLSAQHNYRATNLANITRQIRYVTITWWLICVVMLGVAFALKIGSNLSRGSTLSFFVIGWIGLVAFRIAVARGLHRALESGTFAERRVILITEKGGAQSSRVLDDIRKCGYLPIETIEISQSEISATGVTTTLQEKITKIISICHRETIDNLFILVKWNRPQLIESLVRLLRVIPIPVNLLPDENVSRLLASPAVNVGTAWTIELQRAPLSNVEQTLKRAFDVIGASIAILLLSPLMLMTAVFIKLDSKGPILFVQRRNGFNHNTFRILKFRTMNVLEDGNTIVQATRNDSRVTSLGRWLRLTSIDELPQLFNVIFGDMSLVGPRPHALAHDNEYEKLVANYAYRHHMKPGITGWAQVNGYRGETRTTDLMARRVEFDLWYVNHWSLWLDLKILLKTLAIAYRQPTAY
jgi:undecaprenyl-phosphate galactose phosphotransferase/putative colanic acid biosynthesis UDP-glucose lipid carrier transferase